MMSGAPMDRYFRPQRLICALVVTVALLFSLWAGNMGQAFAMPASHHQNAVAGHAADNHADSSDSEHSHCGSIEAADEAGPMPLNFGSGPARHCHAGTIQLGHVTAGTELSVFGCVVDVLRPGSTTALSFTVLDPPFTPPRSI